MFVCPECKQNVVVFSISDVRRHLRYHQRFDKIKFPIVCCQTPCCKSYNNCINNYIDHFETYHSTCITPPQISIEHDAENANDAEMADFVQENYDDEAEVPVETPIHDHQNIAKCFISKMENLHTSLKNQIFEMVRDLRGKGNIPLNVTVKTMVHFEKLLCSLIDSTVAAVSDLKPLLARSFQLTHFDDCVSSFHELKSVLAHFRSEYFIRQQIEHHPYFILPEKICLGSRSETERTLQPDGTDGIRIVQRVETAEYVSIQKTIRVLLGDPQFVSLLFEDHSCDIGSYCCFRCGDKYKNDCFLSDPTRKTLMIQLYYDGLGITNPIGCSVGEHNSGLFYWSCLNLPPRYNSTTNNSHLVAMCNSQDIKSLDSLNVILQKIVSEISILEKNGIEIETESGPTRIYATLVQFTGDNLAMNQILGFIESFAGDYCCILCLCKKSEMQLFTRENQCSLRSEEEYECDLQTLQELADGPRNVIHSRGVKHYCLLNDLQSFHVTSNWINDGMHTALEGFVPYVMGAVLSTLAQSQPHLTYQRLNEGIASVFSVLLVQRHDRPRDLNDFLAPGQGMSPKQGAAKSWVLLRYMPIILSDIIVLDEESFPHMALLLLMQEIIDIMFAPKLTESLLIHFESIIENFLIQFKDLYHELSVKPKMHFLLHYPSIIRKNGPIKTFWCMAYERKNGLLKLPSHIMKNYRAPQQTLAYRMQCMALSNIVEKRYIRDFITTGKRYSMNIDELQNVENINEFFAALNENENSVSVFKKLICNGIEYRVGSYVIVRQSEYGYVFGKIVSIIYKSEKSPVFVLNMFDTVEFSYIHHSYSIKEVTPSQLLAFYLHDFLDHTPLDGINKSSLILVRLQYHVIDTKQNVI